MFVCVCQKDVDLSPYRLKFPESVKLLTYQEFISLAKGKNELSDEVNSRIKKAQPGAICTLIYTR